jgi:hypothetical protein
MSRQFVTALLLCAAAHGVLATPVSVTWKYHDCHIGTGTLTMANGQSEEAATWYCAGYNAKLTCNRDSTGKLQVRVEVAGEIW